MSSDQKNVLVLIFDGFNTLDVNGPLEVLCNYALRQEKGTDLNWNPYQIFVAASQDTAITAFEFVQLCPKIDYVEALKMITSGQIDILIVPGYAGKPSVLDAMIDRNDPIFNVIQTFFDTKSQNRQRWLISICVGALINAYVGVFNGREATTHWAAIEALAKYSKGQAKVVRKRWVDGGTTSNDIRILSSGGVSCGMDAMLYFISQDKCLKDAQSVAWMMDYVWNGGPTQPSDKPITTQWVGSA